MKRIRKKRAVAVWLMCLLIGFFYITMTSTVQAATSSPSPAKQIADVPELKQYPELPTGCEATALTMLLQWAHVAVKKTDVAAAFPKVPIPDESSGQWIGGNPNQGFVGDPFTEDGYGVYHGPVAAVLNHFLTNRGKDLSGSGFDQVISVVDSGRPVVVWITDDMAEPKLYLTWDDGAGHTIHWMVPEHVVIVTGYTKTAIQVHDPERGSTMTYPRDLFQKRWEEMGRQAVTVTQPDAVPGGAITSPPASATVASQSHVGAAVQERQDGFDHLRNWFARKNNTPLTYYGKVFAVVLVTFYLLMMIFSLIRKLR